MRASPARLHRKSRRHQNRVVPTCSALLWPDSALFKTLNRLKVTSTKPEPDRAWHRNCDPPHASWPTLDGFESWTHAFDAAALSEESHDDDRTGASTPNWHGCCRSSMQALSTKNRRSLVLSAAQHVRHASGAWRLSCARAASLRRADVGRRSAGRRAALALPGRGLVGLARRHRDGPSRRPLRRRLPHRQLAREQDFGTAHGATAELLRLRPLLVARVKHVVHACDGTTRRTVDIAPSSGAGGGWRLRGWVLTWVQTAEHSTGRISSELLQAHWVNGGRARLDQPFALASTDHEAEDLDHDPCRAGRLLETPGIPVRHGRKRGR